MYNIYNEQNGHSSMTAEKMFQLLIKRCSKSHTSMDAENSAIKISKFSKFSFYFQATFPTL